MPLAAPRIASRRSSTAELVAALLPNWRGPLTSQRMARVLRRAVDEVHAAIVDAMRVGQLQLDQERREWVPAGRERP